MTLHRFGVYALDTDDYQLTGPDGAVDVEPQVFDVLAHLVERAGELVTKEQLLDEVWGDRFVSESAMTSRISAARRAVGDDGRRQDVIQTVHGRGYRFIAEVDGTDLGGSPIDGRPGAAEPGPGSAVATGTADAVGVAPTAWPQPRLLPSELRPDNRRLFVGRQDEVDLALRVTDVEGRDRPSVLWLLGEPGIGKTRLAAKIAHLRHDTGTHVLFGRCSEELTVPYEPFLGALRSHLQEAPDPSVLVLGPGAAELVRLEPSLAELVPTLEGERPPVSDPDTERYRLVEAVAGWLEALTESGPTMLILDDMHWADQASVQLLQHLVQRPRSGPLAVVVTARDTNPDENADLTDVIAALDDRVISAVVRLEGLDEASIGRLVTGGTDVERILVETAGNPLLVQAVVGDATGGPDLDLAVRRRLSGLPPQVHETLGVAAVAGLDFDVREVAVARGVSDLEVIADLEQATGARLLDELDHNTFRFSHALIRDALRDGLSESRRARVHSVLAAAIAEVHAADLDAHAPRLVRHHLAAGGEGHDRHMGIRWSLVAGRQAHDLLSFAEAVRHFDTALGLCPPDDESEEAQRAAILLAKATTQARAGRHVPALATFKAAFDSAQRAQDAQTLVDAALGYEDARWRPGLHGGPALPLLAAAEAVVEDDDVAHRARIAIGTARALMYTGDKAAADVAYERAASLVAEADDPHIEAGYLEAFLVPVVVDPPPGYLDHADRLRSLGDRTGSTEHILMAGQFRIRELLRTGRIEEAVSTHEDMTRRTQEQRSPFWNYIVATHRASLDLFEGELDRAERSADHALEIAETLPEEDHSGVHGLQMFLVRREQDRLGVVAPLLRRLIADRPAVSMWDPGLGVFLADIGDLDTARASFERLAADDFAVNPLDAMWPAVMAFSIELALALDDPGRAALLLERVERLSGTLIIVGHDIANLGSTDRFIGLAAMTAGRAGLAERHLDLAIEQNEAMGSPLWAGHSRLAKAWWLAREGDEPGARALAAAVGEAAEAAGHTALARKARAL